MKLFYICGNLVGADLVLVEPQEIVSLLFHTEHRAQLCQDGKFFGNNVKIKLTDVEKL
jgi:hypothetical protein